jgi:NAD-dependent DNA ligase
MSENIQQKIEDLRKELHQHNENYYLLDTPTISDYDFDMLLEELRDLEAKYPEFYDENSPTVRVGGGITKVFLRFSINSECILWIILMILMILKTGKKNYQNH